MIAGADFNAVDGPQNAPGSNLLRKGAHCMRPGLSVSLALAAALFVCASAATARASAYVQHKVSSGKFPIHSACMMPPHGYLTRIGVKGAEGMTAESATWAAALEALVESHLRSDGIGLTSATNRLSSGASDDEIRGVILEAEQKFRTVSSLMDKKPGKIAKSAYTLTDEVGMLPCSGTSDILVFVQGAGQVVTGGRAAMSLLIGGPVAGAVLLVTMADAKTGEILGLIRIRPDDDFLLKPEAAFGERLNNELATMNIGSARKNAEKSAQASGH